MSGVLKLGFCFQSERLLYGREPDGVAAEPEIRSREAAGRGS